MIIGNNKIEEMFEFISSKDKELAMSILNKSDSLEEAHLRALIELHYNTLCEEHVQKSVYDIEDIKSRFIKAAERAS